MIYYLKQKVFAIGDKYNIFDASENLVYKVQSEIFSFGAKFHLLDLGGNEQFYIAQKLFNFMPTYEIYKGDTLCATVKKKLAFLSHKIEVECEYGHIDIDGDIFAFTFDIKLNGQFVGAISKAFLTWGDTYQINLADNQDQAFFLALVIAIDHCEHNENRR